MENALVITSTEKSYASITDLLRKLTMFSGNKTMSTFYAGSGGMGRRLILERDFSLVFISAPLPDESGEDLARQIALNSASQVILAVKSEIYDAVTAVCEGDGVFTIEKPISHEILRQVLSLARTVHTRMLKFRSENEDLKEKLEDIRTIDRAKNILISSARMSEHEAHRYIEKKAMDTRTSKRAVSKMIIYDYENESGNIK